MSIFNKRVIKFLFVRLNYCNHDYNHSWLLPKLNFIQMGQSGLSRRSPQNEFRRGRTSERRVTEIGPRPKVAYRDPKITLTPSPGTQNHHVAEIHYLCGPAAGCYKTASDDDDSPSRTPSIWSRATSSRQPDRQSDKVLSARGKRGERGERRRKRRGKERMEMEECELI